MIDAVASYLSGNQTVTANVPVIAENTARLISIQDTIRSYEELQTNAARVAVAKSDELLAAGSHLRKRDGGFIGFGATCTEERFLNLARS